MTASTSFDGLLSMTRKLIMPSDLISRLQPKKKMPKTTVSASTHITAICTARMMNTLRSSSVVDTNPLSVTTEDTLQHDRKLSLLLLENKALSVSLKTVEFILNYSPGSPGREEQFCKVTRANKILTEFVGRHAVERMVVLGPVVEVIRGSGVQRTGV
ncbi:unnamed protein product [Leuciscus chuanchicus]